MTNWKSTKPIEPLTAPDVTELKKAVEEMRFANREIREEYVSTILEFECEAASLMSLFKEGVN